MTNNIKETQKCWVDAVKTAAEAANPLDHNLVELYADSVGMYLWHCGACGYMRACDNDDIDDEVDMIGYKLESKAINTWLSLAAAGFNMPMNGINFWILRLEVYDR